MSGSSVALPRSPGRATLALRTRLVRRPRLLLVLGAACAFALALLQPAIPWEREVGTTLLVVDITQSMNVVDATWEGRRVSRLDHTRALLSQVVHALPCGHRVGVGAFTERKTMLLLGPVDVCAHHAAVDEVLRMLDWRMAWAADSHIYYGVYSALDEIERRWPGASLAFFSDGHQAPPIFAGREPRRDRSATSPQGILFGVGERTPRPVPRLDDQGRTTGYWSAEDAAQFAATGGGITQSVADMDKHAQAMADPRNAAQRPAGSGMDHLSPRKDEVLEAVARAAGLGSQVAGSAAEVAANLRALPSSHRARHQIELHDALVAFGALCLLASLLPVPRTLRRSSAQPPAKTP